MGVEEGGMRAGARHGLHCTAGSYDGQPVGNRGGKFGFGLAINKSAGAEEESRDETRGEDSEF